MSRATRFVRLVMVISILGISTYVMSGLSRSHAGWSQSQSDQQSTQTHPPAPQHDSLGQSAASGAATHDSSRESRNQHVRNGTFAGTPADTGSVNLTLRPHGAPGSDRSAQFSIPLLI